MTVWLGVIGHLDRFPFFRFLGRIHSSGLLCSLMSMKDSFCSIASFIFHHFYIFYFSSLLCLDCLIFFVGSKGLYAA